MHKIFFRSARWMIWVATLTLLAPRGLAQPEYKEDWAKNFRIGVMAGFNIKANLKMSGDAFGVSGGHTAGTYDDGYVLPDSTGNADGKTWNWGYQNSSQVQGNQLFMHNSTTFEAEHSANNLKDEPYIGFDMAYGGILWRKSSIRVGWELGFGFLPIEIADSTPVGNVSVTRSRVYFNIPPGVILPGAPYSGSSQGPGPLIDNGAHPFDNETMNATLTGSHTLDVTLYTFKLGPTLFWDANRYIGVQIGAGPAFGLVSGNLRFDETLTFPDSSNAHNSGKVGSTEMTYGGYVNALVTVHLVKNGDLYIGAQYMPMGKVNIGGGGREAELDLKGQIYISAGINWPF
jgi:hypothetical protein